MGGMMLSSHHGTCQLGPQLWGYVQWRVSTQPGWHIWLSSMPGDGAQG